MILVKKQTTNNCNLTLICNKMLLHCLKSGFLLFHSVFKVWYRFLISSNEDMAIRNEYRAQRNCRTRLEAEEHSSLDKTSDINISYSYEHSLFF